MRIAIACLLVASPLAWHDAQGRTRAPIESRRLKSPIVGSEQRLFSAGASLTKHCAGCHGDEGKSKTKRAAKMQYPPTDLTNYLMKMMKDGEIYWIVTNGMDKKMPAFSSQLSDEQRCKLVLWVRELRMRQLYKERIELGTYEWKLPSGFPHPNVPSTNLMTAEKVELGRHLFYDKRLSLNRTQSCASCHQQAKAFTDGRSRAVGSTGETHPRGSMSLLNVAYNTVLTWANPNLKKLEEQALAPIFGDHPVELGMAGQENLLLRKLRAEPRYVRLFAAAFADEPTPFSLSNVT